MAINVSPYLCSEAILYMDLYVFLLVFIDFPITIKLLWGHAVTLALVFQDTWPT